MTSSSSSSSSSKLLATLQRACSAGRVTLCHPGRFDAFVTSARPGHHKGRLAERLAVILDYDLTMSAAHVSECHHLLCMCDNDDNDDNNDDNDDNGMPAPFRRDARTLFDGSHPALYGPHSFWVHYHRLLVRHGVTRAMIERAVAHERKRRGVLLREGVAELLDVCEAAGIVVVVLSAGLEPVVRASLTLEGVTLPTTNCHVLTNRLVFASNDDDDDDDDNHRGPCIDVLPRDPPASRQGKLHLLSRTVSTMTTTKPNTCSFSLILMVGDKPVDAHVTSGLPPHVPRTELSFGFFNQRPVETGSEPPRMSDWTQAFDLLAQNGNECTFAPVTALIRHLLRLEHEHET